MTEPIVGTPVMAPPPPTVVFGEGRRPEASTLVSLPAFDGPLGLLLALIESQKLDVLTVPLGVLAGAYLEALASLEGDRIGNVSAFVAVASQLILIKSRAMLPRRAPDAPVESLLEEGDPEADLRARLILYRAFRDGGNRLQDGPSARFGLFRREPAAAQAAALAGSRPPAAPPLDPTLLVEALDTLMRIVPLPPPPPEAMARTVTIGERTEVIRAALRRAGALVLQELLRDVRDRVVVTVTFLALLELAKQREIVLEQAEPWGPIVARLAEPAVVTADRPASTTR
ncbi:MAG TPA: ScpA family protein [Candidatus Limnocylindrales bacterium]